MYSFGCSRAVMQVIFIPLFEKIFHISNIKNKVVLQTNIEDIGDITTIDTVAGLCAYSVGFVWLFMALTVHHPEESSFFWITQDVFGACMCIMFLSLIKLNSMRVAAILLIVAFFYDIFFVFITPLIFKGESVMITVATSGGPPKADPSWCEKYPDDADCQGGDPLPMLLTIPRVNDYLGGSSLLGLGDIVLPGLLLSFAARMDAAKSFMGIVGGGGDTLNNKKGCSACFSGYFYALVVAYAIGLFMANAAVYLMNMGQPALLYLVPMCLGTFCYLGWKRNELLSLWEGPRLIKTADAMIYGEYESLETDVVHLEAAQPSPVQDTDRDST
jgi:Signal peptide peptidase